MYVLHPVVDDAQTRHGRLFPLAPSRVAHLHRRSRLPRRRLRLSWSLDFDALVRDGLDAFRARRSAFSYAPLPCHAENHSAEGYRLAGRSALGVAGVAGGLCVQLR